MIDNAGNPDGQTHDQMATVQTGPQLQKAPDHLGMLFERAVLKHATGAAVKVADAFRSVSWPHVLMQHAAAHRRHTLKRNSQKV